MPDIKQILASEAAKAIMPVSKQVQNKKAIPPLSAWRVHCITPFAPIDAVDREADPSDYYQTTLEDGTKVFTEWTPKEETEITRRLLALGVKSVVWHRTTLGNYKERLASIPRNEEGTIIFNLLDGHESDGWPGVSMMRAIEEAGIPFTGASSWFYDMDTIKHKMKKALVDTKAATPGYVDLTELTVTHEEALQSISKLKMPVLVKPSPSSGSLGLTEDSVCYDVEKAWTLALKIREQFGGAYVEEFIKGREFTVLVSGSAETSIRTYPVVERVFNPKLPAEHQFLSFKMKWEEWGASASAGKSWWYAAAAQADSEHIEEIAKDIYKTVGGNGYCRMDLRMDSARNVYCVDVNANCSIDVDPDTAMGLILKTADLSFEGFVQVLLQWGFERWAAQ